MEIIQIYIFFIFFVYFSYSYNMTEIINITADDLLNLEPEQGEKGCYLLYDSGANTTEDCTQFILKQPFVCCKVHYEIDIFKNDFCMPVANNTKALEDVKHAFRNAKNVDIDCFSFYHKFTYVLLGLFLFILIL